MLVLPAQLLLGPPDLPGIPLLQAARQTAYQPAQEIEWLLGFQLQPELQRPRKCHFDPCPARELIMPREGHDDSDDVDRYRKQSAEQQHDERHRREQYQQDDASDVFSGRHDESPVYLHGLQPLELRFMELLQQLTDDLILRDRFLRDDSRIVSALLARSTSNLSDAALRAAGVVMLGASGQRTMITFGCRRVRSRQSRLCRRTD